MKALNGVLDACQRIDRRLCAEHVNVFVLGGSRVGRREFGRGAPEVRAKVDFDATAAEDADSGEVAEHAVIKPFAGADLIEGLGGRGKKGEEISEGGANRLAVSVDFNT